jgi:succinyl-CoA synthetase alpha subunit
LSERFEMKLTPDSKVLVQGITEPLGSYYTAQMLAYGTNIVAGVSAGQGGEAVEGIPVFDLVEQAIANHGSVDTTIIFVPSYGALDAALEAIDAGIRQIVLVTRGIPPLDVVRLLRKAQATDTLVIGPNSSGVIVPGKILLGTHREEFYTPGNIGLISRTGPLTYEAALALTQDKLGQSISVSLGTDPIVGSSFGQWLKILAADPDTEAIVLVDQTGGGSEENVAEYIAATTDKPIIAYVAGRYTPVEQQLNDAGTILAAQLSGPVTLRTTAQHKVAAFKQANVPVAERPSQIPELVRKALK